MTRVHQRWAQPLKENVVLAAHPEDQTVSYDPRWLLAHVCDPWLRLHRGTRLLMAGTQVAKCSIDAIAVASCHYLLPAKLAYEACTVCY